MAKKKYALTYGQVITTLTVLANNMPDESLPREKETISTIAVGILAQMVTSGKDFDTTLGISEVNETEMINTIKREINVNPVLKGFADSLKEAQS